MPLEKFSVVFPGQGSQYVGMLEEYFENHTSFKETFLTCSEILNLDLEKLLKKGPKQDLARTEITQPLMLAADVALWNLISTKIGNPVCFAGHSLGEYAALVAAKVISLKDAFTLVRHRSIYMQQAAPVEGGGIAAILGLNEKIVTEICSSINLENKNVEKNHYVNVANINSSNQIVISGTKSGVELAIKKCKDLGAKRTISLAMSIPAHCALMKPAADRLSSELDKITFETPNIPIIQNFDFTPEQNIKRIKVKLSKQIYSPVRWFETIKEIKKLKVKTIIECGPGKVLSGLTKRISPNINTIDLDNYNNFVSLNND